MTRSIYVETCDCDEHLSGWIEIYDHMTADELEQAIDATVHGNPWRIETARGFGCLDLDGVNDPRAIVEIADLIREDGSVALEVLYHFDGDPDRARVALRERHAGCGASLGDWAEDELTQEGMELACIPQALREYFDFEAYADAKEINGEIFSVEARGTVHVFWNR